MEIGTIVINTRDMAEGLRFWCRALDYHPRDGDPGPETSFVVLVPRSGTGVGLSLQRSSEPPNERPDIHIDLYVGSRDEQLSEVDRLVRLGARQVEWDYPDEDADFVVLADPTGNRFCIINHEQ